MFTEDRKLREIWVTLVSEFQDEADIEISFTTDPTIQGRYSRSDIRVRPRDSAYHFTLHLQRGWFFGYTISLSVVEGTGFYAASDIAAGDIFWFPVQFDNTREMIAFMRKFMTEQVSLSGIRTGGDVPAINAYINAKFATPPDTRRNDPRTDFVNDLDREPTLPSPCKSEDFHQTFKKECKLISEAIAEDIRHIPKCNGGIWQRHLRSLGKTSTFQYIGGVTSAEEYTPGILYRSPGLITCIGEYHIKPPI